MIPAVGYRLGLELQTTLGLELRLFVNNQIPQESHTEADYTEASGFGYAAVMLDPGTWAFEDGVPCIASYPRQTFAFTGALGNVYGYYLVVASTGKLLGMERFNHAPFNIQNDGDQIRVAATLVLGS